MYAITYFIFILLILQITRNLFAVAVETVKEFCLTLANEPRPEIKKFYYLLQYIK